MSRSAVVRSRPAGSWALISTVALALQDAGCRQLKADPGVLLRHAVHAKTF